MISKELLSEVLGLEIKEIKNKSNGALYVTDNCVGFSTKEETTGLINIYELAHKCKEWAKSKHFIDIDSHCDCARWGAEATAHNGRPSVFYEQVFIGRTEHEAIFKACKWIKDNK